MFTAPCDDGGLAADKTLLLVQLMIRSRFLRVEQVQERPSKLYDGRETLRGSLFFMKLKAHALKSWNLFVTGTPGKSKSALVVMASNIDYIIYQLDVLYGVMWLIAR